MTRKMESRGHGHWIPAALGVFVVSLLAGTVAWACPSAGGGCPHDAEARAGGWLGIEMVRMTPALRAYFGAPEDAGVLVGQVVEDSPAAQAGLQVGDVVVQVDEAAVATPHDLARAVRSRDPGTQVTLRVIRKGQTVDLTVTLGEPPTSTEAMPHAHHGGPPPWVRDTIEQSVQRAVRDALKDVRDQLERIERDLEQLEAN